MTVLLTEYVLKCDVLKLYYNKFKNTVFSQKQTLNVSSRFP